MIFNSLKCIYKYEEKIKRKTNGIFFSISDRLIIIVSKQEMKIKLTAKYLNFFFKAGFKY